MHYLALLKTPLFSCLDTYFNVYLPLQSWHLCQGAEKIADALKQNRSITNVDLVSKGLFV